MSRASSTALALLLLARSGASRSRPRSRRPHRAGIDRRSFPARSSSSSAPSRAASGWPSARHDDHRLSSAVRRRRCAGRRLHRWHARSTRRIAELRADPAVAVVEPNYRVELADETGTTGVVVDDSLTGDQYSLDRMRVRDAWSAREGRLERDRRPRHRRAAEPPRPRRAASWPASTSSTTTPARPTTTGMARGSAGSSRPTPTTAYGIAGISWTDKVMPVKIMNGDRHRDHGRPDGRHSLGGGPRGRCHQHERRRLPVLAARPGCGELRLGQGSVLVGAAGNNRREETYYPASFDNVVSVSATQLEDEFSNWSSWGPKVDVSAPGLVGADHELLRLHLRRPRLVGRAHVHQRHELRDAEHGRRGRPHPGADTRRFTPGQVVSRLTDTVDDLGYAGWDNRYGAGRVNAYRAVGGSVAAPSVPAGDSLEANNSLASARQITLGAVTRPTIYPAGDVDWFAVDVPRAGRLDVRVTGRRRQPRLSVEPEPDSGRSDRRAVLRPPARSSVTSTTSRRPAPSSPRPRSRAGRRILVKVWNFYANGNRATYTVSRRPTSTPRPRRRTHRLSGDRRNGREPHRSAEGHLQRGGRQRHRPRTVRLRDMVTQHRSCPATVDLRRLAPYGYDHDGPAWSRQRQYRVEATTGGHRRRRKHAGDHDPALHHRRLGSFIDADGNKHEASIEWISRPGHHDRLRRRALLPERPRDPRPDGQLPGARPRPAGDHDRDHFTDDEARALTRGTSTGSRGRHHGGLRGQTVLPDGVVTRAQMATFLVRALDLPPTAIDYFSRRQHVPHEARINAVAAAGLTGGCTATTLLPDSAVTRAQMADIPDARWDSARLEAMAGRHPGGSTTRRLECAAPQGEHMPSVRTCACTRPPRSRRRRHRCRHEHLEPGAGARGRPHRRRLHHRQERLRRRRRRHRRPRQGPEQRQPLPRRDRRGRCLRRSARVLHERPRCRGR